jgi:uncharacterized protein (DUF2147 family)
MKKIFITIVLIFISINGFSQSVVGKWKTIDDVSGKAKSVVEIYEKSGKIYGKIIDIIDETKAKELCVKCEGADKDKPILGLVIIKGLSKDGNEYSSGKIVDPKSGTIYKCKMALNGTDKLDVRGYVGVSLFGRTQTWIRQ